MSNADMEAECQKEAYPVAAMWGSVSNVAGAVMSTAGRVSAWEEKGIASAGKPGTTSMWRSHAAGEPVVVCFLDGEFPSHHPPVKDGPTSWPDYDRFVVIVGADGTALPYVATSRSKMPVQQP
ncbi:MAG TPA: hypothetical protein VFM01_13500 [Nakamurella sp.]|jgi:hypothetical protein|nr:hypothetical protein [Nakamurella sp.]